MLRDSINTKLSKMAKEISPNQTERNWVSKVYNVLDRSLSKYDCSKIGSYPRYTTISPIHDLDLICSMGIWNGPKNPKQELATLSHTLKTDKRLFKELPEIISIKQNHHSISIEFTNKLLPSIDLIPCYQSKNKNEFNDPIYYVPEVSKRQKVDRINYQSNLENSNSWIKSDPKGYINLARIANDRNECFRKTTKLVKYWKKSLYEKTSIRLKSFHLEQIIMRVTIESNDMIESVIKAFRAISSSIYNPNQIRDRAQPDSYIDDYVAKLTTEEKSRIILSIKNCLAKLEGINEYSTIEEIFADNNAKMSQEEKLITFNYGFIPCFDEENHAAKILCTNYENRAVRSKIDSEKLYFKLHNSSKSGLKYYWKVSNSHSLPIDKWRGEITEGRTLNYPETKSYSGIHSVECYAVNSNGECVSYDKCPVELT